MEDSDYKKLLGFREFLIKLTEFHQDRAFDESSSDKGTSHHLGVAAGLILAREELEKTFPFWD